MTTTLFNAENFIDKIEVEPNVYLDITDVGNGPTVLLIHGWPLNKDMFEYQVNFLSKQGYRVITPTLRGFGGSSKPFSTYDYQTFARDIHQIVNKLNLNNFIIGGFSMGAAIAMYYAVHYGKKTVRQLLMIGAAAPIYTQKEDFQFDGPSYQSVNENLVFLNRNRPELLDAVIRGLWSSQTVIPHTFRDWLFYLGLQASLFATEQSMMALRDSDLRKDMATIEISVAIFHGKYDMISPFVLAQAMHAQIQNTELFVFENSGHALLWEEQDLFHECLLNFLKK